MIIDILLIKKIYLSPNPNPNRLPARLDIHNLEPPKMLWNTKMVYQTIPLKTAESLAEIAKTEISYLKYGKQPSL